MRVLATGLILFTVGGCSALVEPRTIQDGDAVDRCQRVAVAHEADLRRQARSVPTGEVVLREEVILQGVQGSARLACAVDFGTRRVTSATLDGVEHVRRAAPF